MCFAFHLFEGGGDLALACNFVSSFSVRYAFLMLFIMVALCNGADHYIFAL